MDRFLAPGSLVGDWRIEETIGAGGMGAVYSAVHQQIGKHAAIKVIRASLYGDDSTAVDRFLHEAWVVNQIGHPNIVDTFDLGRLDDGRPYLVMELVRGQTLGTRMDDGKVPAPEAIDVLIQVCRALAAAHAQGVLHRDLKPDNVLLAEVRGVRVVKLCDWGIAKMKQPPPGAAVTDAGTMLGTPRYISPEQARGKLVDERTDIYSLGAIAYELFLESTPFTADNVADLLAAHLCEPVPPPSDVWPDIPPALEQLLLAMLAKSADERPGLDAIVATLEIVRDELASRVGGGAPPPLAPPKPATIRIVVDAALAETMPPPPPRTRRWVPAIAAVLGAFAIAAVFARAFAVERPLVTRGLARATPPPVSAAPAPLATLDLRFTPPGAHATVDGVALDGDAGRAAGGFAPGGHQVVVTAPGFLPYRRAVEVGPDGVTLAIDLEPERAPAPQARRAPRVDPDALIDPFR